jgi:hypothetical protein
MTFAQLHLTGLKPRPISLVRHSRPTARQTGRFGPEAQHGTTDATEVPLVASDLLQPDAPSGT